MEVYTMPKRLFLGVDIGSTSSKAALMDDEGRCLGAFSVKHGVYHERPDWSEHDADGDWWNDFVDLVRKCISTVGIRWVQDWATHSDFTLSALGVCGLVPCLLPLGERAQPLRRAILYSDNRAGDEAEYASKVLGKRISTEAVVPKMLWLKAHEPHIYQQTRVVLTAHSFIVFRLTGNQTIDFDTANIMGGIFDNRSLSWESEDLFRTLGLRRDLFPRPLPATAIAGYVSKQASAETLLPEGTPVMTGTGDSYTALLGCGAIEPGDAMIYCGTSGTLMLCNVPLESVVSTVHVSEPLHISFLQNVLTAGELLEWFGRLVDCRDFQSLDKEASALPPGANGLIVLPHFQGKRGVENDPHARGTIWGLTPAHSRPHIYRALLESFAYSIAQSFEPTRNRVSRVIFSGGGSRSPLWRQIMADVLEFPIEHRPKADGALAVAYLSGRSIGALGDFF